MYDVIAETEIKAEKRAGKRAYLALVQGGERRFAKQSLKEKNRKAFSIGAKPGDVFEARHYWWDGEKDTGGTVWFTIDGEGRIHPLTREEAMEMARGSAHLTYQGDRSIPARVPAPVGRMPLTRIACHKRAAEEFEHDGFYVIAAPRSNRQPRIIEGRATRLLGGNND